MYWDVGGSRGLGIENQEISLALQAQGEEMTSMHRINGSLSSFTASLARPALLCGEMQNLPNLVSLWGRAEAPGDAWYCVIPL